MAPDLKRFKFADASVVTLEVRPEKKISIVHKGLLCGISLFFKAALEGHSKESLEAKIQLPEDSVTVIEDFLQWLYTRDFNYSNSTNLWHNTTSEDIYHGAFELYGFTEKVRTSSYFEYAQ